MEHSGWCGKDLTLRSLEGVGGHEMGTQAAIRAEYSFTVCVVCMEGFLEDTDKSKLKLILSNLKAILDS